MSNRVIQIIYSAFCPRYVTLRAESEDVDKKFLEIELCNVIERITKRNR